MLNLLDSPRQIDAHWLVVFHIDPVNITMRRTLKSPFVVGVGRRISVFVFWLEGTFNPLFV
jgi:hypothetical protein